MQERPLPDKFLVAFSFAGEQRDLVRSIAEEVEKRLGHGKVFLDEWYEHYIAGDNADQTLQDIYHKRSELVVFWPPQENLWVNFGSGRAPSVWYNATSSP